MGIANAQLTAVSTLLVGFSGEVVEALGEITLPLSLGSFPKRATKMVNFLVVNATSAYNVILGCPSLNMFQVVGSTYHMKLKFPTPEGVDETVSAILTVEKEREHKPVYYVSKVLQGAEIRYTKLEKLALAIIVAGRKLRPYFLSHQVTALTNHPLKKIISSPKASGRMTK
ncbi:uncharacterized protein [Primulina eburnea]|uniref:uncharacterized protein n=1 Tax=Primulina eburnea TaxID=1245227 RepID=UPI003C6C7362